MSLFIVACVCFFTKTKTTFLCATKVKSKVLSNIRSTQVLCCMFDSELLDYFLLVPLKTHFPSLPPLVYRPFNYTKKKDCLVLKVWYDPQTFRFAQTDGSASTIQGELSNSSPEH